MWDWFLIYVSYLNWEKWWHLLAAEVSWGLFPAHASLTAASSRWTVCIPLPVQNLGCYTINFLPPLIFSVICKAFKIHLSFPLFFPALVFCYSFFPPLSQTLCSSYVTVLTDPWKSACLSFFFFFFFFAILSSRMTFPLCPLRPGSSVEPFPTPTNWRINCFFLCVPLELCI